MNAECSREEVQVEPEKKHRDAYLRRLRRELSALRAARRRLRDKQAECEAEAARLGVRINQAPALLRRRGEIRAELVGLDARIEDMKREINEIKQETVYWAQSI